MTSRPPRRRSGRPGGEGPAHRRPPPAETPLPGSLLAGQDEPILRVLPQTVIDNLRRPASENALVWNLLYPLADPFLSLQRLLEIRPLWGTARTPEPDEDLRPYFWGYSIEGERLALLDEALEAVDGPGPKTEVDVFLAGGQSLVLVEAKHLSGLGRCGRYGRGACPEIHRAPDEQEQECRYWLDGASAFANHLEFGLRPTPESTQPPCDIHYQLGRTLLLARELAARLRRRPQVWMMVPRRRWRQIELTWLDFAERVRDPDDWRGLRVLAWEDVRALREPR